MKEARVAHPRILRGKVFIKKLSNKSVGNSLS